MTDNLDAGMDDLVKRLRERAAARAWNNGYPSGLLEAEAASEIERLRRPPDVAVLREALEPFQRNIPEYDDREFTTITVRVSDLRRARQALAGAGEVVETPELVKHVGMAIAREHIGSPFSAEVYEDFARAAIRAMLSSAPSAAEGDQK